MPVIIVQFPLRLLLLYRLLSVFTPLVLKCFCEWLAALIHLFGDCCGLRPTFGFKFPAIGISLQSTALLPYSYFPPSFHEFYCVWYFSLLVWSEFDQEWSGYCWKSDYICWYFPILLIISCRIFKFPVAEQLRTFFSERNISPSIPFVKYF